MLEQFDLVYKAQLVFDLRIHVIIHMLPETLQSAPQRRDRSDGIAVRMIVGKIRKSCPAPIICPIFSGIFISSV